MMQRIIKRLPDLDVFIDTGDAHHGALKRETGDIARGNWTDIIAGGCSTTPFFYVAGNHEIVGTLYDGDQEWRRNALGSVSCRPYYSFDIKGIHFISLPELVQPIYINKESMEWLALDLEINKDKTIILLSHNNIKGTTTLMGEIGYRGLVNSRELMELFKLYPNVISWMHGHNHTFEVVEKEGMLYVSNGRIGGFVPPKSWGRTGQGNLGGIYFEISSDSLTVRGYSATEEKFFDEMGDKHLSGYLEIKTTLEPHAKPSYSYGVGGAKNKERFYAYNHHSGPNQKREMYVTGCQDAIINDDPLFNKYTERHAWHGLDKILIAAKINHGNSVFEYTFSGIRLKSNSDWFTTVTLPCEDFNRYSYYRCPVDTNYKITIDLKTYQTINIGKQVLWLLLLVHDSDGKILRIVQSEGLTLLNGNQKHEVVLNIPPLNDFETIYSNPDSDKLVNISVEASISGMEKGDVEIRSLMFSIAGAEGKTINPGLLINNEKCLYNGEISKNNIVKLPLDPGFNERDVIGASSDGLKRLTFIVKHSGLEWQVRNAAVKDCGNYLEIKKMRNRLSDKMEIIIVPLIKTSDTYIHRIIKSEGIKIYPLSRGNKTLKVEINKLLDNSQIQVFSYKKPVRVTNVLSWNYENNIISAVIDKPGIILFHF